MAGTERIGTVTDVRGGTAYVDPDVEQGRESLGRSTDDERDTLDEDDVTDVGTPRSGCGTADTWTRDPLPFRSFPAPAGEPVVGGHGSLYGRGPNHRCDH